MPSDPQRPLPNLPLPDAAHIDRARVQPPHLPRTRPAATTIQPVPATRLFLAAAARSGNGHGYLTRPPRQLDSTTAHTDPPHVIAAIQAAVSMHDEPEAVGPAIAAAYARRARRADFLRHARTVEQARIDRKRLTAEDRLRDAQERAKHQHRTDLRGELHALAKSLDRARRTQGSALEMLPTGYAIGRPVRLPATAMMRLERVEASLDRLAVPGSTTPRGRDPRAS